MKDTNSQRYIFGNGNQPVSGEYYHAGIFLKYVYGIAQERIIAEGPTPSIITVEVYRVSRSQFPRITYTYYTPDGSVPPPTAAPTLPPNNWITSQGQCSVTCGTGKLDSHLGPI